MNEQNVVAWMIGGGDRRSSESARVRSAVRRLASLAERRRPQAPDRKTCPQTAPVGSC